ncbi:hypothetical protein [Streptomyces sp. NPDC007100]|uniref:hypothetical protein n=1 Tax=Streptomyces sp. NPDC007100 TaxID=3155602 RepID=UPI0033FB5007
MDTYEGIATLEWWANRSTSLGGFDVRVTISATNDNWTCDATHVTPLTNDDQDVFDTLMQLDPVFTLHFDETNQILVNVAPTKDTDHLTLTAYEPAEEPPRTSRS